MAIVKKTRNNKCWRRFGEKGIFVHFWWECKLVQPLWKTVWKFLKKLNITIIWSSNSTFGYILKGNENRISKRYMHSHIYYSIIHSSQDWSIDRSIYLSTYYSAMRKKEILPFAATSINLEGIMLSEVSHTNTVWYHL